MSDVREEIVGSRRGRGLLEIALLYLVSLRLCRLGLKAAFDRARAIVMVGNWLVTLHGTHVNGCATCVDETVRASFSRTIYKIGDGRVSVA